MTSPIQAPYSELPDSIRIILTLLTILSITIQLYTLWTKKSSKGISLNYTLCLLLVATSHLTKETYMTLNVPESAAGQFTHDPLNTGDWLNFIQVLVTWILFLFLFILSLYFRPDPQPHLHPRTRTRTPYTPTPIYILTLLATLLSSLLPLLLDLLHLTPATLPWPRTDILEAFVAIHAILLTPLASFLGVYAFILQSRQRKDLCADDSALSVVGLMAQSIVFGLVALNKRYKN
ncbi:hypothetical protein BO94DRAFT_625447 [Aspergillus sclerotioniger CBS 115572]|uniref:Uncharacterized protein n=1 Tax=Aspergillus sclerotioniger CBS 115572 TaxID=1450535 RepID=A0A317WBT9_9EURO|nr:hypothetical protein BO94DRAFT_625447 [Aspergillus sclerotioniger CBS 115572]PWY83914.1 hypothetical protein BO94DRAFT_625447 [Aspergillus sclerotioniger CBS 115572]